MKMKSLYIMVVLIGLLSCKKEEEFVHKKFDLESFHTLDLNDSFEVELIEQEKFQIELLGDKEFVEETRFNVQDSILSIKNEKRLKWTDPANNIVKLIIKGKGLRLINANETCDIKCLNPITTQELGIILKSKSNTADVWVDNEVVYYWNNFPCGGKLTIRGKTNEVKLWNYAIMTVDALGLEAKKGFVENYSKGDCLLRLSEELFYKIGGEGNIRLWGGANTTDNESTGSGKLIIR